MQLCGFYFRLFLVVGCLFLSYGLLQDCFFLHSCVIRLAPEVFVLLFHVKMGNWRFRWLTRFVSACFVDLLFLFGDDIDLCLCFLWLPQIFCFVAIISSTSEESNLFNGDILIISFETLFFANAVFAFGNYIDDIFTDRNDINIFDIRFYQIATFLFGLHFSAKNGRCSIIVDHITIILLFVLLLFLQRLLLPLQHREVPQRGVLIWSNSKVLSPLFFILFLLLVLVCFFLLLLWSYLRLIVVTFKGRSIISLVASRPS